MKKKVRLFGREFSILVVAVIAVMGIVTASYLTYFGVINAQPTVNQGLFLDEHAWDSPITEGLSEVSSLSASQQIKPHYLYNNASDPAYFTLSSSCTAAHTNCNGITTSFNYPLSVLGTKGTEDRVVVSPQAAGITTLSDLNSVSWNVNDGTGYAPHLDVYLDLNGDGVWDSTNDDVLVFEYAKVDPNHCDNSEGYPIGNYTTFKDKGNITGTSYAWLNSGAPGDCSSPGYYAHSLTDWKNNVNPSLANGKTILGSDKILRMEFEIDNWIEDSSATLSSIRVNGDPVEASYLGPGGTLDFNVVYNFDKLLNPDTYTITTKVNP